MRGGKARWIAESRARYALVRGSGFTPFISATHHHPHRVSLASGTGRNMAPFLSLEWGQEGMELMREIKDVFDPSHILNPGVILNDDPRVHVANLKHITPVGCPRSSCPAA